MNEPVVDQAGPVPEEMLKDKIEKVLKTLTYRERWIIKLRYGLDDGYRYTRKEVGRIFKTLPDYIRKTEERALRKLQHPIRSRKLEGFLDTLAAEDLSTPEGSLLQKVFGVSAARANAFNLIRIATLT